MGDYKSTKDGSFCFSIMKIKKYALIPKTCSKTLGIVHLHSWNLVISTVYFSFFNKMFFKTRNLEYVTY